MILIGRISQRPSSIPIIPLCQMFAPYKSFQDVDDNMFMGFAVHHKPIDNELNQTILKWDEFSEKGEK